ncbi:UNVERIFIED_CONTAM: hypothetical protein FKN15_072458 [Acipenser sinensis]
MFLAEVKTSRKCSWLLLRRLTNGSQAFCLAQPGSKRVDPHPEVGQWDPGMTQVRGFTLCRIVTQIASTCVRTQDGTKFVSIGALYSELVAVSTKGELYQWKWSEVEPYRNSQNPSMHHPRAAFLGLMSEKITLLSANSIRATVATENNKVATWVDDTLSTVASKLEHSTQTFPELQGERIVSLHCCALYTCAQLENCLYWWGVVPFSQRKKMLEKARAKNKKPKSSAGISSMPNITVGTQVCLRNNPLYHTGAVAFSINAGIPKVGVLMESVWNMNDSSRFQLRSPESLKNMEKTSKVTETKTENKPESVKTEMGPPPSPASTCSDTSSIASSASLPYKRRRSTPAPKEEEKVNEEQWSLREVVFVEDVKNVPVGKVVKTGGTPKVPDCFQRTPKKLCIPEKAEILAVNVDSKGVHAVLKTGNWVRYCIFDLATGKAEQENNFPTSSLAFLGQNERNVAIFTAGQESPVLLRDGNGTIYPVAKDCMGGIRDPDWLDLPPISSLGMGIHSLTNLPANSTIKKKAAIIIMAVEVVKTGGTPKVPDCFQRTPKKLCIPEKAEILAVNVDSKGVHAVLKTGNWVRYCIFDLATGKAEQENNFPTSSLAFLGQNERNVAIFTAGQESPVLLRDGNGTIYPVAKDCMGGIRDPDWLDLPPISSLGMGIHSLTNLPANSTIKKKAAIIIMAVEGHISLVTVLLAYAVLVRTEGSQQTVDGAARYAVLVRTEGSQQTVEGTARLCCAWSQQSVDGAAHYAVLVRTEGSQQTVDGAARLCCACTY